MKKIHLLWIFLYPLYQVIGTIRHEGSHALVAFLCGAHIDAFVFWPTLKPEGGILWGYVNWSGNVNWFVLAAPYIVDLLTFTVFFLLCARFHRVRPWVWLNMLIVGIISPLFNSLYNYRALFFGYASANDVTRLAQVLPDSLVHLYFLLTLLLYILGLLYLYIHYIYQPKHI